MCVVGPGGGVVLTSSINGLRCCASRLKLQHLLARLCAPCMTGLASPSAACLWLHREQLFWWGLSVFAVRLGQPWMVLGTLFNSLCMIPVTMVRAWGASRTRSSASGRQQRCSRAGAQAGQKGALCADSVSGRLDAREMNPMLSVAWGMHPCFCAPMH